VVSEQERERERERLVHCSFYPRVPLLEWTAYAARYILVVGPASPTLGRRRRVLSLAT
jgi:hypothetical protein